MDKKDKLEWAKQLLEEVPDLDKDIRDILLGYELSAWLSKLGRWELAAHLIAGVCPVCGKDIPHGADDCEFCWAYIRDGFMAVDFERYALRAAGVDVKEDE